jgi:ABC-2 type transport system permease protein
MVFLLKTFNVPEILIAILIEVLIIMADLKLYSLTKDFATKLYFEKE